MNEITNIYIYQWFPFKKFILVEEKENSYIIKNDKTGWISELNKSVAFKENELLNKEITISDIKRINIETGHKFFDKETIKFWNSKILPSIYKKRYFITIEKDMFKNIFYNVRYFNIISGDIITVGKHFEYVSIKEAKNLIKELD